MKIKTLIKGKIFTSNPEKYYANAMLVENDKIVWIGDQSELTEIPDEQIDLKGSRILPGFIDAHLHPLYLADAQEQIACMAPNVYSIADLIIRIKEQIETQEADDWIESWGYDEGKLAEGRAPNRYDLDKASVELPIIVTRSCGHIITVNSKALDLAEITKKNKRSSGW